MVRFYSDLTKKWYEDVASCEEAERLFQEEQKRKEEEALQKSTIRKEAAKKVDEAYKKMIAAKKEYHQVLSDFCKEHGYYHVSLDSDDIKDWIDSFWESMF